MQLMIDKQMVEREIKKNREFLETLWLQCPRRFDQSSCVYDVHQ